LLAAVKMAEVSFYSTLARAARDKDTCDVTYLMCECGHKVEIMVEGRALGHEDLVDVGTIIGVMQPVFDRDTKPFEERQCIGDRGADGATSFSEASSAPST
jgi:hypothetical protein